MRSKSLASTRFSSMPRNAKSAYDSIPTLRITREKKSSHSSLSGGVVLTSPRIGFSGSIRGLESPADALPISGLGFLSAGDSSLSIASPGARSGFVSPEPGDSSGLPNRFSLAAAASANQALLVPFGSYVGYSSAESVSCSGSIPC